MFKYKYLYIFCPAEPPLPLISFCTAADNACCAPAAGSQLAPSARAHLTSHFQPAQHAPLETMARAIFHHHEGNAVAGDLRLERGQETALDPHSPADFLVLLVDVELVVARAIGERGLKPPFARDPGR